MSNSHYYITIDHDDNIVLQNCFYSDLSQYIEHTYPDYKEDNIDIRDLISDPKYSYIAVPVVSQYLKLTESQLLVQAL